MSSTTSLPPNRLGIPPNTSRRNHLSLQVTDPATYAQSEEAEYSPLEAPALPFSSSSGSRRSRTRSESSSGRQFGSQTRPHSSSSLPSLANTSSSPTLSPYSYSNSTDSLPSTSSRTEMHGRGLSDAQEELLVEAQDDRDRGKDRMNPYAWERPLDAVNRHSRMLDVSPQSQISDSTGRRVSRLPPGVQMLDPFGFSLAAEASPYDLALKASSAPVTPGILTPSRSPVRSSFLQPHLTTTSGPSSSNGHSQIASSSSIGSNLSNASTTATSPTIQPWTKPRASSAGEVYQLNSRAQIKSGLLGPPQIQRGGSSRSRLSKLSGEIDAETMSIASTASKQQLPAFVPADSDYINSKLYARTIKAQKALEKEREKAAAKGKMSRYDSEAAKSTSSLMVPRSSMDTGRPSSIFSVASTGKMRSGRKSGLGWFRSSSEAALSTPPETPSTPSPPLPTSRSATTLALQNASTSTSPLPPSPNLASDPIPRSTNSSSDYLREARETVSAHKLPPPTSRQTSSSSNSSGGGEELARPVGIPVRASRHSPASSFQHSPTIRESSPPRRPIGESEDQSEPPYIASRQIPPPPQTALPNFPPPAVPSIMPNPPRPTRHDSLDSRPTNESTTPTPPSPLESTTPIQSSSPPPILASSGPPRLAPASRDSADPTLSGSRDTRSGPPQGRLPQPPVQNETSRSSQVPFPPSANNVPTSPRRSQQPSQPSNSSSVIPPPLLSPDVSLANGAEVVAEVGVKRRKSSLGLLFGGGGSKSGKSSSPSTSPVATQGGFNGSKEAERAKMVRRMEERSTAGETKPPIKEKVKEKVKESFFGRVKRPEMPESKPVAAPPRPRQPSAPTSAPSTPSKRTTQAPLPPPGARAPAPHYSQNTSQPPSNFDPSSTQQSGRDSRIRSTNSPQKTAGRAPDSGSSASASTTYSTLSSSSSTLPPTPGSGRSSNGLSKSVNNGLPPKSNGGGAFANFFGRHRTKSMGATTPSSTQKLSRSKNATPTPDYPVLPIKGTVVDRFAPMKKPSRTGGGSPQPFPGAENYAPSPVSNGTLSAQRGYPTYA
ncbi:hypothetical protein JCM5353_001665 [Sporobolomyces roseus]